MISRTQPDKLFDKLKENLCRQISAVERDDLECLDNELAEAGQIVKLLSEQNCFDNPDFTSQKEHLNALYRKLELSIAVRKTQTDEQIKEIKRAGKMIRTYDQRSI